MVFFWGKKKKPTTPPICFSFTLTYTTTMLTILLNSKCMWFSPHTTSNALRQQLGELQCNSTLIGPGHRVR